MNATQTQISLHSSVPTRNVPSLSCLLYEQHCFQKLFICIFSLQLEPEMWLTSSLLNKLSRYIPQVSVEDHDVLELDVLHPVPVGQGVMISMVYKDKAHQDNHLVVKLI